MKTAIVAAADCAEALTLLRAGEVVALPTETVYGLAADALNSSAVARIFAAKERPRFDPLIVHLPDRAWLEKIAGAGGDQGRVVEKLAHTFWPGPLTLVLPKRETVPDLVTAGLDTVAVRISSHPVFAKIIQAFGGPIAAPSANRFGRISPTAASHVFEELEGRIPLIVDAGSCKHGLESTIVAPRNGRIEILRRGPISEEQLAEFGEVTVLDASQNPQAPGQLLSHYAPRTSLILTDDASAFVPPPGKRCGLLSWKSRQGACFAAVRFLSERADLIEAAARLFRYLRELDGLGLDLIVAERVPDGGLGAAINDRLRKASRRDRRDISSDERDTPEQTL